MATTRPLATNTDSGQRPVGYNPLTMSSKHRFPAVLVAVALLLRAAVPLGYMPGKLFAGEFMVLCPVGSAPSYALLDTTRSEAGSGHHNTHAAGHSHHGHTAHHNPVSADGAHAHHDEHAGAVDDRCPIGSALNLAFLPGPDVPLVADWPSASYPKPGSAFPAVVRFNRGHPVRGPPAA